MTAVLRFLSPAARDRRRRCRAERRRYVAQWRAVEARLRGGAA